MLFFKDIKAGSLIDEIRCDEPSYLIWKWHPAGVAPSMGVFPAGQGRRSCSIRVLPIQRNPAGIHRRPL